MAIAIGLFGWLLSLLLGMGVPGAIVGEVLTASGLPGQCLS